MYGQIAVIIFLHAILFAWCIYISLNSYEVILKGLQKAYFTWLVHLFFLLLEGALLFLRPWYQAEPHAFVFNNKALCSICGKVEVLTLVFPHFLITLFSSFKATLYYFAQPWIYRTFSITVLFGIVPIIALVIVFPTGATKLDGFKSCAKSDTLSREFWRVMSCHFMLMNFIKKVPVRLYTSSELPRP